MGKTILITEDDDDLGELISLAGIKRGYEMKRAGNGGEARELILAGLSPSLIILDINMPGLDGFGFCRWLREDHPLPPVIFLSARTEEYDKILALEIGGDDYLTKPFSMKELYARVAVSLRRVELYGEKPSAATEIVKSGELILDRERWTCAYREEEVILTVSEFRILAKLAEAPGRVFSRDELVRAAFPEDLYNTGRSVDIHISRIRSKLKNIDSAFHGIQSIYQVGYKWQA